MFSFSEHETRNALYRAASPPCRLSSLPRILQERVRRASQPEPPEDRGESESVVVCYSSGFSEKKISGRDMSYSKSDGCINTTRSKEQQTQASNSSSRVEEERAVLQAEERCVVEEGRKSSALGRLLGFFYEVIRNPLVNAAVAIFSLGVGVGLMLSEPSRDEQLSSEDNPNGATGERRNIRSDRRHQIEELPEHSPAAALLPSQ
jgi:hypothetical protein